MSRSNLAATTYQVCSWRRHLSSVWCPPRGAEEDAASSSVGGGPPTPVLAPAASSPKVPKDAKFYTESKSKDKIELGDVVAQVGCGGSLVVHQAVKPAVPGSNPASLQPTGTCHTLLGSQQVDMITAGWPLKGQQRQQNTKKNYKRKNLHFLVPILTYLRKKKNLGCILKNILC